MNKDIENEMTKLSTLMGDSVDTLNHYLSQNNIDRQSGFDISYSYSVVVRHKSEPNIIKVVAVNNSNSGLEIVQTAGLIFEEKMPEILKVLDAKDLNSFFRRCLKNNGVERVESLFDKMNIDPDAQTLLNTSRNLHYAAEMLFDLAKIAAYLQAPDNVRPLFDLLENTTNDTKNAH